MDDIVIKTLVYKGPDGQFVPNVGHQNGQPFSFYGPKAQFDLLLSVGFDEVTQAQAPAPSPEAQAPQAIAPVAEQPAPITEHQEEQTPTAQAPAPDAQAPIAE